MIDFIRFIGVVKSQYKQDLHCSSYKEKNFYTTSPSRLARLYFSNTYLISRVLRLHLAYLKQYPKANRPEYNEIAVDLQPCQ